MPSVPSSRTQKAHSACCPREAAKCRHGNRAVISPLSRPAAHPPPMFRFRPYGLQWKARSQEPDAFLVNSGCIRLFTACLLCIGRKPSVSTVPPKASRLPQSVCSRNRSPLRLAPPGAGALLCLRRAARARGSACQRRQGRFPLTPLSARAILAAAFPAHTVLFIPTVRSRANRFPANIRPTFRPTAFTAGPPTIHHPRRLCRVADYAEFGPRIA